MEQNRQDIDEHLLLQYLQGTADEELHAAVEAWLNADGRNRKHLDRLESLWIEAGAISPPPVAVDVDAAWQKMSGRIASNDNVDGRKHSKGKLIRMRPFHYVLSAAAAIIVLFGIFSLYRLAFGPAGQTELASGMMVLQDSLPDGSKVTLNLNSNLTYTGQYKKGIRQVKLTGEAFFEVKKDAAHPFTVDVGAASVQVLGTSFRVKTSPDAVGDPAGVVEVAVSEGRVVFYTIEKLTGDTASLILHAGETGILAAGSTRPVLAGSVDPDGLFWANRSLDFRNNTLSEVFTVLKQYYQVNITVSDPGIMDCRLTASFVDEPPDRILTVIAESFGLTLQISGQNFQLSGNGCSKNN